MDFHYFVTSERHVFDKKSLTENEWATICRVFDVEPRMIDKIDKIVVNPKGAVLCGNFKEGDTYNG